MSITRDIQTAQVAEAFDGVAHIFEQSLENELTRKIREKIYATIQSLIPRGASILDINCGVGIDAVALAQEGYNVLGVDISPKMIDQAKARAKKFGMNNTQWLISSVEDLSPLQHKSFDLVLSNFGGLNCLPSLQRVAEQVANVVRPPGYFIAIVMPPVSAWEIIGGIARLNFSWAFRRLRHDAQATGFRGKTFSVYYYSPRKFLSWFKRWFDVKQVRGLNIFSPPPHATRFKGRYARLSTLLERWDVVVAYLPLVRAIGDHYMIVLQKQHS